LVLAVELVDFVLVELDLEDFLFCLLFFLDDFLFFLDDSLFDHLFDLVDEVVVDSDLV
jgi:hypothetical protein